MRLKDWRAPLLIPCPSLPEEELEDGEVGVSSRDRLAPERGAPRPSASPR